MPLSKAGTQFFNSPDVETIVLHGHTWDGCNDWECREDLPPNRQNGVNVDRDTDGDRVCVVCGKLIYRSPETAKPYEVFARVLVLRKDGLHPSCNADIAKRHLVAVGCECWDKLSAIPNPPN